MRQDKDRSGKWLLTHHGDAILKLAGITGFTAWKAIQSETVAPRRLPDGLIEVSFPGEDKPTWVLLEIEAYPDSDVDRQIFDDLLLIALDRKVVPEVVSLVLKPKGNLTVTGSAERLSPRGRTRIAVAWPVIRLWELDAESLLAAGDVGLIPWVPLTKTTETPNVIMDHCRERLVAVPDRAERLALAAVTQIMAELAFPNLKFDNLTGERDVGIEAPFLEGLRLMEEGLRRESLQEGLHAGLQVGRQEGRQESLRKAVASVLKARFGIVSEERIARLATVQEENRLEELHLLAVTCPDLDAFVTELATEK